ncbi:protein DPCD [Onthophagus taurus]|uniref:protein DPCD n=1 Tax=Onthophagus taurus TaxID=166361 RepID=UPI000C20A9D3|nr:protein DPCD [Onthophagus taurus]
MSDWLSKIKSSKKSSISQGNLKKVHYEFTKDVELVEEYNTDTEVLTRRAWRRKTHLGGEGDWDVEIGDPEPSALKKEGFVIRENNNQPIISRRITKNSLEWRIRNLPYPLEVYSVSADPETKSLVVRTSNKKYFKVLVVPELVRAGAVPNQESIQFTHKYNTLIITYKKPKEVVLMEKAVYEEVKKVESKSGDIDPNNCKPS